MSWPGRRLIVGVGNLLLSDEGFGVLARRLLSSRTLPSGVHVLDGGTALLDVMAELGRYGRVVIVDAVRAAVHPERSTGSIPLRSSSQLPTSQLLCRFTSRALGAGLNVFRLCADEVNLRWQHPKCSCESKGVQSAPFANPNGVTYGGNCIRASEDLRCAQQKRL